MRVGSGGVGLFSMIILNGLDNFFDTRFANHIDKYDAAEIKDLENHKKTTAVYACS